MLCHNVGGVVVQDTERVYENANCGVDEDYGRTVVSGFSNLKRGEGRRARMCHVGDGSTTKLEVKEDLCG